MRWCHRIRGHVTTNAVRHIDMGSHGAAKIIEAGRIEYGTICSCGRIWWDH